jgi:hypothetical protein
LGTVGEPAIHPDSKMRYVNVAAEDAPGLFAAPVRSAAPGRSKVAGRVSRAVGAFLQYSLIDLFSVNLYFGRCFYANANLIPFDSQHRNRDVITYNQFFPDPSCQYQHSTLPLVSDTRRICAILVCYAFMSKPLARRLKYSQPAKKLLPLPRTYP